ncbi:urease accessory protein UreE [Thiohalocapsa sp. ML1]|uniref:urease accessory protein UreE n=1 Tax=Thiohalocapsa sp. ML1 TaxID=1431688 RepID=UPI0007320797|nr:urease accessory protein UreE [Thiohalocapsa sp. ML1]
MTDADLPLLTLRLPATAEAAATAALTLDQRQRSRQRIRLDDGREAGVLLPRGEVLRHGDVLGSEDGLRVRITAAPESLSCAETGDPLLLARACYHLGNRHVALQVESGRLCWLHDHVLDAMVRGLGLNVTAMTAPFEPEAGAYAGHGHDGHGAQHGHHGADHGHGNH